MTATFILSLDCEGKWGVADHLDASTHEQLSDARLKEAYSGLGTMLDRFDVPATFAFVGCFSLPAQGLAQAKPKLEELARVFPSYLGPALQDMESGSKEGWSGDWALAEVMGARTKHEIALHGATHVPYRYPGMSEQVAREELGLIYGGLMPELAKATTFVYPRNMAAHQQVLAERGLIGWRGEKSYPGRVLSLLREFNVLAQPEAHAEKGSPIVIPSGFFLNWRTGLRKMVPLEVTRLRARLLLKRAARAGRVVHYWSHPENFAAAPETFESLRVVLEEVRALRERGQCEVLTQDAYCRRIAA